MLSLTETSLMAGVLVLAVVALRALLKHRLPKGTLVALWAVVVLRLLIPLELPSPVSVYTAARYLGAPVQRAGVFSGEGMAPAAGTAAGPGVPVAEIVWAAGAAVCAACFVAGHVRGLRRYAASLPVEQPFAARYLREHGIRRKVRVRCSDRITSPLTYGVLFPVILVPKGMDWADEGRAALILAHEMAHIRRCDALSKWVLTLALCLHWFNPLIWVMYVLANRDLELYCDETVVRQYGPQARAPYARALVEMEERRAFLSPLDMAFSRHDLEERIVSIMKTKKTTVFGVIAAVILVAAVSVIFATNASRTYAPPEATTNVGDLAVSSYVGADVGVYEDWYGAEGGLAKDPATGHYYTRKQYDAVMKLKTKGYEGQSIAAFNRAVHAAFENGEAGEEDSLYTAYELVRMDLSADDPNAPFLLNTLPASLDEYASRLDEVYRGKEHNPSFTGRAQRLETADVYGEKVEVGQTDVDYSFSYRILDQDGLTVAERDRFLTDFMAGVQAYLDGLDADALYKLNEKTLGDALKKEMDRLGEALSNAKIKYTGAQLSCSVYHW